MGAECSKLRQPMRAIFALSRAQLLLLVVTRSRDLSRECHVTKHKTPARSNFPLSNFENSGTIQFSLSSSTSRGLCPKNFEKRAHPTGKKVKAPTIDAIHEPHAIGPVPNIVIHTGINDVNSNNRRPNRILVSNLEKKCQNLNKKGLGCYYLWHTSLE